jgi:predicted phosphodiesterase
MAVLMANRVAAIYDIHGNLPALNAVLDDVHRADVDHVVVGGDVLPGPMPRETLERLLQLDVPIEFIHGNGELAVLAHLAARESGIVKYWGTTTGQPLPEPVQEMLRWTGRQLSPEDESRIASWPKTSRLEIRDLGEVLFCHGTPRSEVEVFTRLTPEQPLVPVFEGLGTSLVVCGHTHMQFDRMIGTVRVVNAGSVGMPFGTLGADWLLLGPDVQLRHTDYDLAAAAEQIRATSYPGADDLVARNILQSPSEAAMLEAFTSISF